MEALNIENSKLATAVRTKKQANANEVKAMRANHEAIKKLEETTKRSA